MTGIFVVAMNLTAALASGYSISIGQWTGRLAGIFRNMVNNSIACFAGCNIGTSHKNTAKQQKTDVAKSDFNMFKSAQAWNISIWAYSHWYIIAWFPGFRLS